MTNQRKRVRSRPKHGDKNNMKLTSFISSYLIKSNDNFDKPTYSSDDEPSSRQQAETWPSSMPDVQLVSIEPVQNKPSTSRMETFRVNHDSRLSNSPADMNSMTLRFEDGHDKKRTRNNVPFKRTARTNTRQQSYPDDIAAPWQKDAKLSNSYEQVRRINHWNPEHVQASPSNLVRQRTRTNPSPYIPSTMKDEEEFTYYPGELPKMKSTFGGTLYNSDSDTTPDSDDKFVEKPSEPSMNVDAKWKKNISRYAQEFGFEMPQKWDTAFDDMESKKKSNRKLSSWQPSPEDQRFGIESQ